MWYYFLVVSSSLVRSFDVINADDDSEAAIIDECIRWDVKYLLVWCYVYCGTAIAFYGGDVC